jgi:hypothetical protein
MAEYLSPEWIDELGAAISDSAEVGRASVGVRLGVDVRVGPVGYCLVINDGVVAVQAGRGGAAADIALVQDRATAVAIAQGELNAQRAFVDGTVRLEGRADQLIAARAVLEAVDHATAAVRQRTTYAESPHA